MSLCRDGRDGVGASVVNAEFACEKVEEVWRGDEVGFASAVKDVDASVRRYLVPWAWHGARGCGDGSALH